MNNVGVSGCKPYETWLAGMCLFFDQAFLLERAASLSTFFWGAETWQFHVRKPVDKSVTKLWKDLAERRNCWPRAITR
nr:hypothetical protein FEE99_22905 [Pseudomonas sp. ef1]